MPTVYIKELKSYFSTLVGYIFLFIFTAIAGVVFSTVNLLAQSSDIRSFFSGFFTVLLFIIPILTMRQFSEERKTRTIQLLYTLPLSLSSIVLGKFLATMTVVGAGLVVTMAYPLVLAVFGSVETLVVIGSYFGLVLMISAIVSVGLFISAMTENQIVSAVVSCALILGLWLVDSITPFLLSDRISELVGFFSLRGNYLEFTYGILNPASIIHYVLFSVLFLELTIIALDTRRV